MKSNFYNHKYYLIFAICSLSNNLYSQDTTTNHKKFDQAQIIIPGALIATGLILKTPTIQSNIQKNARNFFGQNFQTKTDDYLMFLPAITMLLGNSIGLKSEHHTKQMLSNLAVSMVVTAGATVVFKQATNDLRPDGSTFDAFPSGHTAIAFNNATLQFLEYKNSNIWYASLGYIFASATGILRVANNRHWAGDILTGAGLGMAIGTLVYYYNPLKFNKKTTSKTVFLPYPTIQSNAYGAGLLCQF
ncbi:MAG: hypothetical protein RLZZ312_552 [Bacteroidota bacterium]|jgi:membrane-associated phospholipid phosphatase